MSMKFNIFDAIKYCGQVKSRHYRHKSKNIIVIEGEVPSALNGKSIKNGECGILIPFSYDKRQMCLYFTDAQYAQHHKDIDFEFYTRSQPLCKLNFIVVDSIPDYSSVDPWLNQPTILVYSANTNDAYQPNVKIIDNTKLANKSAQAQKIAYEKGGDRFAQIEHKQGDAQ